MPDALAEALGTPGLGWLCVFIFSAGCVRGFAGFGTALIFVPLAALFLPPIWVIIVITIADITGPLPLVPRAVRAASMRDLAALLIGCALCLPFGTMLLEWVEPETFRWMVAALALAMVLLLASGWQHGLHLTRPALAGIGGASGLVGGLTGMPGPPVILAYLGGAFDPARIRATTLLFLLGYDLLLTGTFLARDLMVMPAVWLGLLLTLPNILGNMLGARIFDPARAALYRGVALGIIAASALIALPLFG